MEKNIAISILFLRTLTLVVLIACIVILITNDFRDFNNDGSSKITFKDVTAYRYAVSTAVIGAAYTLFQLPFAIYYFVKGKSLACQEWWPEFDFYGDKLISYLLAIGGGAGLAVSLELRRIIDEYLDGFIKAGLRNALEIKSTYDDYLNKGIIASCILLAGFVFMAILSVLSSNNRTKS